MADSKITALTAISTVDPTADPLVIVDVSDTSMAASGTTKKSTINQLLGSGGTATLASATITGDLTVDTSTLKVDSANDYVGIGTASPVQSLTISGEASVRVNDLIYWNGYYNAGFKARAAGYAAFIGEAASGDFTIANTSASAAGAGSALTFFDRYRISNSGVHTWEYVGGVAGTAMTLNANGLGIGVTPNTWTIYKALQVQGASIFSTTGNDTGFGSNVYYDGGYKFRSASSDKATRYEQFGGSHSWHYTAAAGTAGNTASFTQAMTLTDAGNLLVGVTAAPSGTIGGSGFIADSNSRKQLHLATTASVSQVLAVFINPNGTVGTIETNGSSTAYNISSDYRLKEEVKPLTGALNRITALKPSTYKWKVDGSVGEGFIAHELAEVVPFAVSGQKDAVNADGSMKTQGVDLSKIIPILVAAVQELTARVQTLEAK